MTTTIDIKALYRSLLREANKLPYGYLRAFFRFKYRDDVDSAAHGKNSSATKIRNLNREIRKIRAANDGDKSALARLLNLAYGRTGKLKRELLEPFLHSSTTEPPPPIIPGVEKSRPPVYSRELTALLLSPFSRKTGAGLKPNQLETPPSIASRIDPSSEEARLRGPLSKRREINARWRFFTTETRRVHPPLQVSVSDLDRTTGVMTSLSGSDRMQRMQELGLVGGGFQDSGLLKSLLDMVGNPHQAPRPSRERKALGVEPQTTARAVTPALPTNLLRRSHRNILNDLPLLTYHHKTSVIDGKSQGLYEVSLARQAIGNSRYTIARLPLIDERNMAWIRRARERDKQQKTRGNNNKLH